MEPLVKRALDLGDKNAYKSLQELNGKMQKLNIQENLGRVEEAHITDHNAPVVPIGKAGKKRREQLAILDSDQNRKAKENAIRELRLLQENFRDLLKNLELPPSWVYDVPVTIDAHEASQPSSVQNTTAPSTASQRPSAENRRTSNPSAATDRYNNQSFDPMDTTGNSTAPSAASQRPSARNRQTSNPSAAAGRSTGRAFDPMDTTDNSTAPSAASQRSSAENRRTSNPSAAADRFTDQSLFDAMDTTPNWTPGETTRGEEIIAFRPVTMTGIMPSTGETGHIYSSIRFVIKSEGRNPIEIVNEARVGLDAVKKYIHLPEEKKCNIVRVDNFFDRRDDDRFGDILGVARDPYATKARNLPWTVVLIEYDGEPRLVNRTALRKAKKEGIADDLINEFLISVGEEPDTPKNLRLEQPNNRLLLKQYGSSERFDNRRARFREGPPRMLPDPEELYYDLDAPSFTRRMPVQARGLHSRNSRQDQFGDEGGAVRDNPLGSYWPTSARPQGPTPVRTAPPVQLASNTPLDMPRNERHKTGAAAGGGAVTQVQFNALMEMVQQLAVSVREQRDTGVYGT
ncbi:hypothetical protein PtrV1_06486 [Pyrenophora tritici-repentis]|nr:hypothetical protein PtrV1_06486 [Pyrenophora tritici-repentis]